MYTFSDLKIFNPALCYTYQPESSPVSVVEGESLNEFWYKIGQMNDILSAYVYIEKNIMPLRQKKLRSIQAEQVERWILSIHKLIAKTAFFYDEEQNSGHYNKSAGLRVFPNNNLLNMIYVYIIQNSRKVLSETRLISLMKKQFPEVDVDAFIGLLRIIERFHADEAAPIHPTLKPTTSNDSQAVKFNLTILKLYTAWHDNLLSKADRTVVGHFITFADYPENLPSKMLAFIDKIIPKWQKLTAKNKEEVSEVCTMIIEEMTQIQPFAKGSSKTALALVNIILRSIGLNDILLYKPNQTDKPVRNYAESVSQLIKHRSELKAHLRAEICAPKPTPYTNEILQELTAVRMNICHLCHQIMRLVPDINLDTFNEALLERFPLLKYLDSDCDEHALMACLGLQRIISDTYDSGGDIEKMMGRCPSGKSSLTKLSTFNQDRPRTGLTYQLSDLKDGDEWKKSRKGGVMKLWRYVDSEEEGKLLASNINNFAVYRATVRQTKNKRTIILCENINKEKPLKEKPLEETCALKLEGMHI